MVIPQIWKIDLLACLNQSRQYTTHHRLRNDLVGLMEILLLFGHEQVVSKHIDPFKIDRSDATREALNIPQVLQYTVCESRVCISKLETAQFESESHIILFSPLLMCT